MKMLITFILHIYISSTVAYNAGQWKRVKHETKLSFIHTALQAFSLRLSYWILVGKKGKISPSFTSENGLVNGFHLSIRWEETCFMVGRDWGLPLKQACASCAICIIPSAVLYWGSGRRWSTISMRSVCSSISEEEGNENDDERDEMKSPGCLPTRISIVTTPKL